MSEPADEDFLAALFERLVDDVGAGRAAGLDAAVAGRPHLRARAAELLALASEIAVAKPVERPRVAGHEILAELGRGGMGTVYLALDRDLGRRVALKVLPRSYAAGARGRDRFLREARAVARLQHPHIVPVYDLGDEDGAPWFTMEWIEGRTLAAAIAAGDVGGPREAARIALEVAQALAHAHAAGVVHRDVKPSNVLLRADGGAMLFDFGLAAVDAEASLTLSGGFVGTPHYASPEQAQGRADVGPAADVWSLGVSLWETLARRRPFEGATTQEVLRAVREDDPGSPRLVDPRVPPDLATVCMTAMEKDPAKRYLSAAEFAADLARFLAGEPVAARPVGPLGRAVRWTRRKPLVATSAALAFLLVVGTPTALYVQQRAATREIARERDNAKDVARALAGVFRESRPENAGPGLKVVDVLDAAARDARAQERPEVRAALLQAIGEAHMGVESAAAAEEELTQARGDFRSLGDDDAFADVSMTLGSAKLQRWKLAEAETVFRDAIRTLERRSPPDDVRRLDAVRALAETLARQGRAREAMELLRPAAAEASQKLGVDHPVTMSLEINLAGMVLESDGPAAAMHLYESLLARQRRARGADHVETLGMLRMTAHCARLLGDLDRAEAESRECIERLRARGIESAQTLVVRDCLASVLIERGRYDDAAREERDVVEARRRLSGEDHPLTLRSVVVLGRALTGLGQTAEAVASLRRAHAGLVRSLGADEEHAVDAAAALGAALARHGDAVEAERILRDALARSAGRPVLSRVRAEAGRVLASLCEEAGRPEEAARLRAEAEASAK